MSGWGDVSGGEQTAPGRRERAEFLFGELGDLVLDMRLRLAQTRDSMLTEAEHIAVLEVYEEFGR